MLKQIINPWVLLASVGIAAVLLIGATSLVWFGRPTPSSPGPATAILTRIPAPTPTPILVTPTPLVPPTPTPVPQPTPIPGSIGVGTFVQIVGTGGDGLRLRTGPSLDSEIRFLGLESEVFEVSDGPEVADEFTWWFLVAPYDPDRRGWAVAPYLAVIENP